MANLTLTGTETLFVLPVNATTGQSSPITGQTTTGAIAALAALNETVSPAVTAHAGGGQTSATLLTSSFNNITVVANAADSVKLPASSVGTVITVSNQGANAAQIFGTSPDTINGVATGTGISIPVGAIFVFTCAVVGNWLQNVQTGGAFTGTFDGVLGGNTPAAATVTTLAASSTASTTALTATATSNQLVLGTTRTLTLTAPTPASSSRTVTLPDPGGADSVAYLALAQTLTNKTLTAPVLGVATATSINGLTLTTSTGTLTVPNGVTATAPATTGTLALINPPPQAGGSTLPVTAAMSGKPILLDTAGGTTATLPAATGTGNKYKFVVTVSTTSAAHKILAASSSDFIIGNAYGYTGSTAKVFGSPAATNHSIQMPNSGSQPSGGIIGDVFDFVDVGTNLWHCIGFYSAGTTPTTPFSSATS